MAALTVPELIALLSKFPPELTVQMEIEHPLEDGGFIVEHIDVSRVKLEPPMLPRQSPRVTLF